MTKYEPLNQFLGRLRADYWRPTFLELERILEFKLPAAARKSAAWWEKDGGASRHAQAWADAGWKVDGVDFEKERVTFVRNGAAVEDQTEHGNEARFAERLREGVEDLSDWMNRGRGQARETVERHPFAVAGLSAGAAFAAGVGLGYLLYRSLSSPGAGAAASAAENRARQAIALLSDHVHDLADAVGDRIRHLRG